MRALSLLLLACLSVTHAFVVPHAPRSAVTATPRAASASMGAAKDGPFTPLVLAAKAVLGDQNLLKLRGKAISYHSQEINKFCEECKRPSSSHTRPSNSVARPLTQWCALLI